MWNINYDEATAGKIKLKIVKENVHLQGFLLAKDKLQNLLSFALNILNYAKSDVEELEKEIEHIESQVEDYKCAIEESQKKISSNSNGNNNEIQRIQKEVTHYTEMLRQVPSPEPYIAARDELNSQLPAFEEWISNIEELIDKVNSANDTAKSESRTIALEIDIAIELMKNYNLINI